MLFKISNGDLALTSLLVWQESKFNDRYNFERQIDSCFNMALIELYYIICNVHQSLAKELIKKVEKHPQNTLHELSF